VLLQVQGVRRYKRQVLLCNFIAPNKGLGWECWVWAALKPWAVHVAAQQAHCHL